MTDMGTSTPPPTLSATGVDGTVTVDGDRLTIHKGLSARRFGVRGSRTLAVGDLAEVRLDHPTAGSRGVLELRPVRRQSPSGSLGEYTVTFTEQSAGRFEQVHARLQDLLAARRAVNGSAA